MQAGLAAQETDVDRCNEHLSQAVGAVKKLMDGFLPPPQGLDSSGQQGEGAGSQQQQQQQQQQQAAQQAYLYHTKALREGLKTLLQRRVEQEQAAAAAAPPSSQELDELRKKKAFLEQRIQECCKVEKALIDQSRSLLDAMACWDATQKQLS